MAISASNTGHSDSDRFTSEASEGQSQSNAATVTRQVNGSAPAATANTNLTSASIPNRDTWLSTIFSSDAYTIRGINVYLNTTHAWDSELQVFRLPSDSTVTELFSNVSDAVLNIVDTVLDDEASLLVTGGFAPFTGTFRPVGNLMWVAEIPSGEEMIDWRGFASKVRRSCWPFSGSF
jgi:hypothetical protein